MSEEYKRDYFEAWVLLYSGGDGDYCEGNHLRGLFKTKGDADRRMAFLIKKAPINRPASWKWRYSVNSVKVERIPGNRFIIGKRVFDTVTLLEFDGLEVDDTLCLEFDGLAHYDLMEDLMEAAKK